MKYDKHGSLLQNEAPDLYDLWQYLITIFSDPSKFDDKFDASTVKWTGKIESPEYISESNKSFKSSLRACWLYGAADKEGKPSQEQAVALCASVENRKRTEFGKRQGYVSIRIGISAVSAKKIQEASPSYFKVMSGYIETKRENKVRSLGDFRGNCKIFLDELCKLGIIRKDWDVFAEIPALSDSQCSSDTVGDEPLSTSPTLLPGKLPSPGKFFEESLQQVLVNRYERNSSAIEKCKRHYGTTCFVCSFDFEKNYGSLGADFIHVHHIVPLHKIKETYSVDPKADLRPVCPNCHAMLHTGKTPPTIDELIEIMNKQRKPG